MADTLSMQNQAQRLRDEAQNLQNQAAQKLSEAANIESQIAQQMKDEADSLKRGNTTPGGILG